MSFETVNDLLNRISTCHQRLAWFYETLGNETDNERVKMLLAYLGRHEKQLSDTLQSFESTADEATLQTWFKYTPQDKLDEALDALMVDESMNLDAVVDVALQLDEHMISIYRALADRAAVPEVREVFQNLLEHEEKEEHQLVRMATDLKRFI